MSVEKDPIVIEEDEDLSGEDEFSYEEIFSCKYCEFQTPNIDDLDEHIVTHAEAILEDDLRREVVEEADSLDEDSESTSINHISSPSSRGQGITDQSTVYSVYSGPTTKRIRRGLPAFYDEAVDKSNKRVFVCPFCGYQSMKKLDMNRHMKEHNEPVELPVYACSECPYTTRRKCDMPKHLLTHCENGTVPMYKCSDCPYATKRKGDLTKHMLCHSKPVVTVYSCTECPYVSKRQGDLKKHLVCHENVSTRGKEQFLFNCTECGYTSKRLNDLHKHAVLHCDRTIKGVFKCTKCDYASAVGSPFAKHVLSHCKIREMPASVFPKDNSMQEYIVLEEEEELHLYNLGKDNVASVQLDKDVGYATNGRKRKLSRDNHYAITEKSTLQSYYVGVNSDLQNCGSADIDRESENSKVVVLTGYEGNEQSAET